MAKKLNRVVRKAGESDKKKSVKVKKPKTRNQGTMTEAAFWGWIRQAFRKRTLGWKPASKCKENSRRLYKGPNKRQRYEYKCNKCKKYHRGDNVQVDHIDPAGALRSADDLAAFISGLFCEIEGLQVLCTECHNKKTIKDNAKMKKNREENV